MSRFLLWWANRIATKIERDLESSICPRCGGHRCVDGSEVAS